MQYKMDIDQQIRELQQLISNGSGDNLKWLVKRLDALLEDKSKQEGESPKKKEHLKPAGRKKSPREGKEGDKAPAFPDISVKDRKYAFKSVSINQDKLEELYNKCESVRDFFN
jgi:hypothetical protein